MHWKKIQTNQAVPGMIAADDIYTYNNLLIISRNTSLTDRIITRLKFYSIYEIPVFIKDEIKVDIMQESQEEDTYYSNIRNTPEFQRFNTSFKSTVNSFKDTMDDVILDGNELDTTSLFLNTNQVIAESRNGFHILSMLHSTRKYDDLTYVHSLNVSLICNVFGTWLKLPPDELQVLTLAGLLHDIGKIKIPESIIRKPSKLTDVEFITVKMHTVKGYNILKDKNIDKRIANAALMHHERFDGSGYPNGLSGHQIDDFAKIIALADVYDAMTSARVYRGPICPFEVIELFEEEGYQKYDPHYLLTFMNGIVQTYMHNNVRLSNGQKGKIIMINPHVLTKPVIQIENQFLDLSEHTEISIVELL